MPTAYVFFATGKPAKWRPIKWRRVRQWTLAAIIRIGSRSRLSHCAVGDKNCVLDIGLFPVSRGDCWDGVPAKPTCIKFWPFDRYILGQPGLVCYFEVPLLNDPELSQAEGLDPKYPWDIFWWWLRRGRTQCRTSCVAVARAALERGGVRTPREIVTPRQLHDWLERQGYHREALE